jgi:PTH1 family peptidyl-tRNA hydrolase
MTWLVAGLGNPGERYASTRHNLGRMVVDELASRAGARLRKVRFMPVEAVDVAIAGERVWLAASTRFMNESGPSYAGLARKHGIEPATVVAVHDEIEIAPGELRLKAAGGSGGHNGLKSLTGALRSPDYLRVRVGVGRPPGRQDPADYVLQPLAARDREDIAAWVERAADAVECLVSDGLATAQDRFNKDAGAV